LGPVVSTPLTNASPKCPGSAWNVVDKLPVWGIAWNLFGFRTVSTCLTIKIPENTCDYYVDLPAQAL